MEKYLNWRFSYTYENFNIMVCSEIKNVDTVYTRCATVFHNSVILFLTYNDIFELLELSRENNIEEISDFMDNKLRKLLFSKG